MNKALESLGDVYTYTHTRLLINKKVIKINRKDSNRTYY